MKIRTLAVTLLLLCGFSAYSQTPVHIPDPNLEAAIHETLQLPAHEPLLDTHMRQLIRLAAPNRGIADLTGLEHAVNLEHLNLEWNTFISDISPLQGLTKLEGLGLGNNNIRDVSPLANLTNLRGLEIYLNPVHNLHLLDHLTLDEFLYDQTCDMPNDRPLLPRLRNRKRPSIASTFAGISPSHPYSDLSYAEQVALYDYRFTSGFYLQHRNVSNGWEIRGLLDEAQRQYDEITALNPNIVFLRKVNMRYSPGFVHPEDSPYWLRDGNGKRVRASSHEGETGLYLLDFTSPAGQDLIVEQAIGVSKCGFYDGIIIDWWSEQEAQLEDYRGIVYRTLEQELEARKIILERIRANTPPDFLITVNHNFWKSELTGHLLNGSSMESLFPYKLTSNPDALARVLARIEETLLWSNDGYRQPHVTMIESRGIPNEPPDSPISLQWMRAVTAMSLTLSDIYVIYTDETDPEASTHIWYDFWDADVGLPVSDWGQLYNDIDKLYIREYTNGWVVYNHSGKPQLITLPQEAMSVSSGLTGTTHEIANIDGAIYLKLGDPSDVNRDGVINILDLILVAQAIGTDDTTADVNRDGVVNVFDLVFIANQF